MQHSYDTWQLYNSGVIFAIESCYISLRAYCFQWTVTDMFTRSLVINRVAATRAAGSVLGSMAGHLLSGKSDTLTLAKCYH